MDWAYLLNSFDGRIGRKTFWIAMAAVTVAEIIGHVVAEEIQGDRLSAIVDLAFTYPEFAIAVKRGHDRNTPLWLLVAFFGAGAVLDLLTVLEMTGTADEPSMLSIAIALPFYGAGRRVIGRARLPQRHAGTEPIWARSAR